jgi:uncharacterized protein (TIGR02271 family)
LEPGPSGKPGSLRVALTGADREILVPPDLIAAVSEDGSVRLRCGRAAAEQLDRAEFSGPDFERNLELKEEQLVPRKELRELGRVLVRKEIEDVPGRLEAEAYREEAVIEHVPVGQIVKEQVAPWEEEGVLVVPVYEEQLVLVKRLVMKEQIRIRREGITEKRLFEDTVRRERLVVEDPNRTGLVREHYPTAEEGASEEESGLLQKLGRKVLE